MASTVGRFNTLCQRCKTPKLVGIPYLLPYLNVDLLWHCVFAVFYDVLHCAFVRINVSANFVD